MIALMAAISFAFVSCSDKDDTESTGGTGGSYVVIPTGNGDVKFEPLSDAEVSALKAKGYNIVGTPVKVTQNGSEHVELNDMATVSIKIPDDFPKEQYGELVGVLISDKGSEYIFPDYAALQKGYVQFKTYHFSAAAAERAGSVQNSSRPFRAARPSQKYVRCRCQSHRLLRRARSFQKEYSADERVRE